MTARYSTKTGVCLHDLHPAIEHVLAVADDAHRAAGITRRPIVTSGRDGDHSANSLHYLGRALDFRTRDLSPTQLTALVKELKARTGGGMQYIVESTHLHCEWDPA